MPKFIIERDMPGAEHMASGRLHQAAQQSCAALSTLGPQVQWVESFVTDDKQYCVYIAPDAIREHARLTGFPADRVNQIRDVIDPTDAEPKAGDYPGC